MFSFVVDISFHIVAIMPF